MTHRFRRAAALGSLFVALASCAELGNPEPGGLRTPPTAWSGGWIELETRSVSVPPSRSNELLRAIAPARPHYVDPFAPQGGVVTMVVVTPTYRAPPATTTLFLVTTFRLRDGSTLRREWSAPARAFELYAGFGLPSPPVEAVTSLAE